MISIVNAQVMLADGFVKWTSTNADLLFGIKSAGLSIGGTYASFIFIYELLISFKFKISCSIIACKSIPKAYFFSGFLAFQIVISRSIHYVMSHKSCGT